MTVPRLVRVGGELLDLLEVPLVTIDTAGGAAITSKVDYVNATFTISRGPYYSGGGQIRGRGNSTWGAPKKPYRIKLTAAASLLGMPADKDWVLLANYFDPSMIRSSIAMEIGRRCPGLPWTPRFRYVEVVLNGAYQGLYQLGEHIKIAAYRIPIVKMSAGNTTGLAVTGGYSLEIDERLGTVDGDKLGWRTAHDAVPVTFDEPDGAVTAQFDYLHDFVESFEAALYDDDWLTMPNGYTTFIDMASWVDWYMVNEMLANQDSAFYSSCKLYKTRDTDDQTGRLHFGPLWDFDLSASNNKFGIDPLPPEGFWTRLGAGWFDRMYDDPVFTAALADRWTTLRGALLDGPKQPLPDFVDSQLDWLVYASRRDQREWGYSPAAADSAASIKTWLSDRMEWLDAQWV